jgi:hypothetical protein
MELAIRYAASAGWGSVKPTLNEATPQQAIANHFYYAPRPHEQRDLKKHKDRENHRILA